MPPLECPVFYPTMADMMGGFEAYIERVCEKKLAKFGLCRIVPPPEWSPRKRGYDDSVMDFTIDRPIRQHTTGSRGLYRALYITEKNMALRDFKAAAELPDNRPPPGIEDPAEIERKYWKNIALRPPLYGADVLGSLFDEKQKVGKGQGLLPVGKVGVGTPGGGGLPVSVCCCA